MERNANHLKIKYCKVNNGRGESPISHVPSENSWLSQSAHNYHRALACASATAARAFFTTLLSRAFALHTSLYKLHSHSSFYFSFISGVAAISTATPVRIQFITVRVPGDEAQASIVELGLCDFEVIIQLAYEVLPFLLVSGPLLLCFFHLYDNAFTPSSEATDDKDKCTRYLHKVLSLRALASSLHFYVLQSAIFAAFSSAN